jgi:radical SAM/Cys-rich protein
MMPNAVARWPTFAETLTRHGLALTRAPTSTLQVNVGRLCNLACRHCHLEAGPTRPEVMGQETMEQVKALAARASFACIDITGGAPEMNPLLPELIAGLRSHTPRLLLRSNLVAMGEADRDGLLALCRQEQVVIVASFPAVNEAQADSQRGQGVFRASLTVLQTLNALGYGQPGSGLELDLVSNPAGAFIPTAQEETEARFHSYWSTSGGSALIACSPLSMSPWAGFVSGWSGAAIMMPTWRVWLPRSTRRQ